MRPERLLPGLVLLVLAAAVCAAGESRMPAPPAVTVPGAGAVSLDGAWEFHIGDNMEWAAPGFDDSGWEQLVAGRPWGQQGHARYSGFAWYRKQLDLRAADGPPDLKVLFPEVDQAYEVYWNGVKLGGCGALPPHPVWFYRQEPHMFPLDGARAGVLAIRVWNAPPLSDEDSGLKGGLVATPLVGVPSAIDNAKSALDFEWLRGHQFVFTENLVFCLVALLSFVAWLRNREQTILLWMTGFTLAPVISLLVLNSRIPIPYTIGMALEQPQVSLRDISLWFLLLWLLDLHENARLRRITGVLAILSLAGNTLDGAMVAVAWHPALSRMAQTVDALQTAANTALEIYAPLLVGLAAARRKRLDAARFSVAISAFLVEMVEVLRDALAQGRRFTHWGLSDRLGAPIVVLGGSAISLEDALEAVLFLCVVYAVYRSFFEERQRQIETKQELKSASELQRVLVPDAPFEFKGFTVTSAYLPAQEVGGDFFQVMPLGEAMLVLVGDVSGKGLRAAMAVSFLVGMARAVIAPETMPGALLGELNSLLIGRLRGGFATCLALRIESNGYCRAASAGHPGPLIDGQEMEMEGALPLGLFEDVSYPETSFFLRPGASCALFTDGLLEARNAAGELFGFERLGDLFTSRPTSEDAAQAAVEFGQADDITVVMIARTAEKSTFASPETVLGAGESARAG